MITSDGAFKENFANEGGIGSRNRFSKNVMGLWLLQEFQLHLASLGEIWTFQGMDGEAETLKPFVSLINPDDPRFFEPGSIVEKLQAFCRETKQPIPESIGAITRCINESLALAYRGTMEKLEELVDRQFPCVHIIGGGAKSILLNRMTASALKKPVLAGPFEATAIGNLCTQYLAAGELNTLKDIRRIVRSSFEIREYVPENTLAWDNAYERFLEVKQIKQ
jgi:sugar (pentulose or hexulose) kinase